MFCFVHNKALSKLACYVRVSFVQRHYITNVNWHPSRIVCTVVQCKISCCQGSNIKRKVGITQRPDIHQGEELQLHDDEPVLELWRGLNLFHAPIAKGGSVSSQQLHCAGVSMHWRSLGVHVLFLLLVTSGGMIQLFLL